MNKTVRKRLMVKENESKNVCEDKNPLLEQNSVLQIVKSEKYVDRIIETKNDAC